jgi:hypothetical protein
VAGHSAPGHRPAAPHTSQAITASGALARLAVMACTARQGAGFPVQFTVTTHDGTAFVIAFQDPAGTPLLSVGLAGSSPLSRSWKCLVGQPFG